MGRSKTDLHKIVTDQFITLLEAGTRPWVKSWDATEVAMLPTNPTTEAQYQGINVPLLWMSQHRNGFSSSYWLGSSQAKAKGGKLKEGEYKNPTWGIKAGKAPKKELGPKGEKQFFWYAKAFKVYNADQYDGYEAPAYSPNDEFEPIKRAELMLEHSGANITEGGHEAVYYPGADKIVLPDRGRFTQAENFYAVALHELTHWTKQKGRCDRQRYGNEDTPLKVSYAFEELVAEMGSAFLQADLQLAGDLENHASYLDSWLKILKEDKYAITKAARLAKDAHHFLKQQYVAGLFNLTPSNTKAG